eukprot:365652-Chlamydomonas_euryale.AAC.1
MIFFGVSTTGKVVKGEDTRCSRVSTTGKWQGKGRKILQHEHTWQRGWGSGAGNQILQGQHYYWQGGRRGDTLQEKTPCASRGENGWLVGWLSNGWQQGSGAIVLNRHGGRKALMRRRRDDDADVCLTPARPAVHTPTPVWTSQQRLVEVGLHAVQPVMCDAAVVECEAAPDA